MRIRSWRAVESWTKALSVSTIEKAVRKLTACAAVATSNGALRFSACVVQGTEFLSCSSSLFHPLEHAEFVAVRKALELNRSTKGGRLEGAVLFSTHEPCRMCLGRVKIAWMTQYKCPNLQREKGAAEIARLSSIVFFIPRNEESNYPRMFWRRKSLERACGSEQLRKVFIALHPSLSNVRKGEFLAQIHPGAVEVGTLEGGSTQQHWTVFESNLNLGEDRNVGWLWKHAKWL
uniref:CMP/dCMP-type deaminase domain-containing protein n=1 Tax=Palpitomonas bilix TaxID=652834 RepID=A0A7S3D145_9EUKA|mmetsp:Transcript_17017/g.42682  ORF Transcript_17017/g.42682 Transcript_17017/m.42682 type:complete len:233 (+) Transcript_17017:178-876(+)